MRPRDLSELGRRSVGRKSPHAPQCSNLEGFAGTRDPTRTSSECCATVEDVPESSTGKSKKSRAMPPETKKVSVKEDGTGGAFTISSTLDSK